MSHYFTVTKDYGLWKLDDTKTDGAIDIIDINADTELTKGTVIRVIGGVITGSKEDGGGGALYLDDSGCKVNLYGGNIIGNSAEDGGGVYIDAGTFTMSGIWTYIAGNEARKNHGGGGVFVDDDSKFVMDGGGIIGNSVTCDSGDGGGVYLRYHGEFTMNDGKIIGNAAVSEEGIQFYRMKKGDLVSKTVTNMENMLTSGKYGGGVYMDDNARFTMKSGLIAGNLADVSGGGVYLDVSGDGEFVMKAEIDIYRKQLEHLGRHPKFTDGMRRRLVEKALALGGRMRDVVTIVRPDTGGEMTKHSSQPSKCRKRGRRAKTKRGNHAEFER